MPPQYARSTEFAESEHVHAAKQGSAAAHCAWARGSLGALAGTSGVLQLRLADDHDLV